jgi:uncharacterized damage-inducible protein DinB
MPMISAACHQARLIEGQEEILLKDTVEGLLWIALFDMVHHRGQLSTYIRPMGGKVPSIYGPSADDAGEWHQREQELKCATRVRKPKRVASDG